MSMLRQRLSDDLLREIFSFDDTYRKTYTSIVSKAFDGEECRALKEFMVGHIDFPMLVFDEWLSMKTIAYGQEQYYEVLFPSTTILFHVMSLDRKDKFDDLEDPESPRIVQNMLHKLPTTFLQGFVHQTIQTLERLKRGIKNAMEFNSLVACMLKSKDYEDLLYHLQVHGKYEEEIHDYIFRNVVQHRTGICTYDEDQAMNYNYVDYLDKKYMVMWYEYT